MKTSDFVKNCVSLDTNYVNIGRRLRSQELQTLVHASLGMSGEVGEVVELVKKQLVQDQRLDILKLKKELGDVLWYMAIMIDQIDSSFEEIMALNVAKLKERYANGFSEQAAKERRDVK